MYSSLNNNHSNCVDLSKVFYLKNYSLCNFFSLPRYSEGSKSDIWLCKRGLLKSSDYNMA